MSRAILRNTFTVGAFTMLSRVLGLVREMFQSRMIGAGVEQSAFALAFAIPNMFRKLFGEGALTAAFVPVFKGELESAGLEKAARLARAVMTMLLLMLGAVAVLALSGIIAARAAVGADDSSRAGLTLSLVAILVPYLVFICGSAFGMGVLNAMGRFKASSFMPALLNIVWIAALGTLAFLPSFDVVFRVRAVAAAILFAGVLQMTFMFISMHRAGVRPVPTFTGWRDEKVRLVWCNMGIAALGSGAIQVNYMLDAVLAQLASPWAAGVIGYAERLMDLPLGVVGVAFGTVLMPTFAGLFAVSDLEGAREALASSMRSLMFIMIPAAFGLFVLAPDVTRVIYEGGDFDAVATVRVSRALAVYAIGLGFFGMQKILVPWFQAQNDMKTPLRVSLITVAVNAVLNVLAIIALPCEWRHVGLAVSTVICAALGCAVLVIGARRRNGALGLGPVVRDVVRIAVASTAMTAALLIARAVMPAVNPILSLALLILIGAAVYAGAAVMIMPDFKTQLKSMTRRKFK